jgi:hypothetical protein
MRSTLFLSVGVAAGTLLLGSIAPAFASGGGPASGAGAPAHVQSLPASGSPSAPPSGDPSPSYVPRRIGLVVIPNRVLRGGSVRLDRQGPCAGKAISDAFDSPDSTVVLPPHDDYVTVRIRTDAALGTHQIVMLCNHGDTGTGTFTVVGQTTTQPSGGVGTGGGGAAIRLGGVRS